MGILGDAITLDEIFMLLCAIGAVQVFWLGRIAGKQR